MSKVHEKYADQDIINKMERNSKRQLRMTSRLGETSYEHIVENLIDQSIIIREGT